MATQVAAVNGASGEIGAISLDNVFIVPATASGSCAVQTAGPATLSFYAVNNSPIDTDRLIRIDTDVAGSVTITASPDALELQPEEAVAAGQQIEQLADPAALDQPITVTLNDPADAVRPGLTVLVTFTFDRAGSVEFAVPLDACPLPPELPVSA